MAAQRGCYSAQGPDPCSCHLALESVGEKVRPWVMRVSVGASVCASVGAGAGEAVHASISVWACTRLAARTIPDPPQARRSLLRRRRRLLLLLLLLPPPPPPGCPTACPTGRPRRALPASPPQPPQSVPAPQPPPRQPSRHPTHTLHRHRHHRHRRQRRATVVAVAACMPGRRPAEPPGRGLARRSSWPSRPRRAGPGGQGPRGKGQGCGAAA
jgi:hypothetical protein